MKHINKTLFKGNIVDTKVFNTTMIKTRNGAEAIILNGISRIDISEIKPLPGLEMYKWPKGYKLEILYDTCYTGYDDTATLFFNTKEEAEEALNYIIDLYNKENQNESK